MFSFASHYLLNQIHFAVVFINRDFSDPRKGTALFRTVYSTFVHMSVCIFLPALFQTSFFLTLPRESSRGQFIAVKCMGTICKHLVILLTFFRGPAFNSKQLLLLIHSALFCCFCTKHCLGGVLFLSSSIPHKRSSTVTSM